MGNPPEGNAEAVILQAIMGNKRGVCVQLTPSPGYCREAVAGRSWLAGAGLGLG